MMRFALVMGNHCCQNECWSGRRSFFGYLNRVDSGQNHYTSFAGLHFTHSCRLERKAWSPQTVVKLFRKEDKQMLQNMTYATF